MVLAPAFAAGAVLGTHITLVTRAFGCAESRIDTIVSQRLQNGNEVL